MERKRVAAELEAPPPAKRRNIASQSESGGDATESANDAGGGSGGGAPLMGVGDMSESDNVGCDGGKSGSAEARGGNSTRAKANKSGVCVACPVAASVHFYALSKGGRLALALVLGYWPKGADSKSATVCDACRKAMHTPASPKAKKYPLPNEFLLASLERLILTSPTLHGSSPLAIPALDKTPRLREGLRHLRDNHFSEGLCGVVKLKLLLLSGEATPYRGAVHWSILPTPPDTEVHLSSRKGDSIAQGLYVVKGGSVDGKVLIRSNGGGPIIEVPLDRIDKQYVDPNSRLVHNDADSLRFQLSKLKDSLKSSEATTSNLSSAIDSARTQHASDLYSARVAESAQVNRSCRSTRNFGTND
jgi:hypothetical protein